MSISHVRYKLIESVNTWKTFKLQSKELEYNNDLLFMIMMIKLYFDGLSHLKASGFVLSICPFVEVFLFGM